MSTALQRLSFGVRASWCRAGNRTRRKAACTFSTTSARREDEPKSANETRARPAIEYSSEALRSLDGELRQAISQNKMDNPAMQQKARRWAAMASQGMQDHPDTVAEIISPSKRTKKMGAIPDDIEDDLDEFPVGGFYQATDGKDDLTEGPDFEFNQDDISSDGHLELEQHRELREFARVIAWDMPLLYQHRQSFEAPTAATPIRFRYTTYLGESHPAAKKVVMSFEPKQLPGLTEVQRDKLIKLLGVRYNPGTKSAKISCEMFPLVSQNKRYLGDLLQKLLNEARDPTDTFADVPFDFRHYKPKKTHEFPKEWNLTEQRKKELASRRQERAMLDEQKKADGSLVEGISVVQSVIADAAQQVPIMIDAARPGRNAPRGSPLRRS